MLIIRYAFIFLTVFAVGCTSTRNVSPTPTPVPDILTVSDVEMAIMGALKDAPIQALEFNAAQNDLSPGMELANKIIDTVLQSGNVHRNPWFYEGRRDGVIFVGYKHRNYYMRVEAKYDDSEIIYSIVDSRNLDQSKYRIHENALVWLSRLDIAVRANLGKLDQAKYEQQRK